MVVRMLGAAALAELMRMDRPPEPITDWLLFGSEDPEVVETPEPSVLLMAAE